MHFGQMTQTNLPIVQYHLAITYLEGAFMNSKPRIQKAIEVLNIVLETELNDWRSYRLRGESFFLCSDFTQAKNDFVRSFNLNPTSSCALKLARIELKLGNSPETVMPYLNQAISLGPKNMDAYLEMGKFLAFSRPVEERGRYF